MAHYRTIYKKHYGIKFSSEYVIHHIDENRENNDIKNLLLLPRVLHSKYHTYKTQYLTITGESGICLDLTYSGSKQRDFQLSYLQSLTEVLSEISYWVYEKYLADNGYKEAYRNFKKYK